MFTVIDSEYPTISSSLAGYIAFCEINVFSTGEVEYSTWTASMTVINFKVNNVLVIASYGIGEIIVFHSKTKADWSAIASRMTVNETKIMHLQVSAFVP